MLIAQAPPPALPGAPSFDRREIQVVPGSSVLVHVSGGIPPYVIVPSSSNVDVAFEAAGATLTVAGLANGRGTIAVIDSTGAASSVPLLVAPAAGTVPAEVSLTLAGGEVPGAFADAQIAAALSRQAALQGGATLTVEPAAGAPLRPGDRLDVRLPVQLHGNGTFVDVSGIADVHVRVLGLPPLEPAELMYSDDPENLPAGADGVLFRDTIAPGSASRIYLYHASLTTGRRVTLALRAVSGPARVQILGAATGPSGDYLAVGHAATTQYLQARRSQDSLIVDLATGKPFLLPLSNRALERADLVAGIFDLRVLAGGPVEVLCVATTGAEDPAARLDEPRVPGDGHNRTGTFSLDPPPLELALRTGGPDPEPVPAGSPSVTTLHAPRALAGGYGVIQRLTITIDNSSGPAADAYLYEVPNGNALTTTLFFDGDAAPLEIPCVKTASVRYLVRRFTLAAGQRLVTGADYMTDGASSYPIQFGLSTAPPQAPDGCGAPAQSG